MADLAPTTKVSRSYVLESQQVRWLQERANALETSASAVLRQVIRAAMAAHESARPD